MEPRRLLLVDDHALFRDGLARLFAYEDDFEVVGEAADGEQALGLAHLLQPDLVLMDVDMPRGGGIAATRRIKAELPATRIVMLTVHDDDDTLFHAIKAGAQGYLVKSIRASEMLELLRGMAYGEAPLSRAMAARILEEFARGAADAPGDQADPAERPHAARGRSARAGCPALHEQGNCATAGHLRVHREEPPVQHPVQAPPAQPRRSRAVRRHPTASAERQLSRNFAARSR